jgi:hypothetical protein
MSLRDHLQKIYDERGKLTPEMVVEEARSKEHPLHNRFEWNNSVAGELYRRQQAHELIRSVKVAYKQDENGKDREVRAFHAIRKDEGYVYEPAEKVAADPFVAKLLMLEMKREWMTMKRRYEEFAEFWQLIRSDLDDEQEAA